MLKTSKCLSVFYVTAHQDVLKLVLLQKQCVGSKPGWMKYDYDECVCVCVCVCVSEASEGNIIKAMNESLCPISGFQTETNVKTSN